MNRRDRVWLVDGKPPGHPGAEVAAMRDVSVISEPSGHQLMAESRDLASGHPHGRRRPAERVTRQRRNDHRKRVGRIPTMTSGIGEEVKHRQVLEK
jgi:hypothetical protein